MGGEDTTDGDGGVTAGLAGALLVVVLALAGLVVLFVRQQRLSGAGDADARSVLDRRYAAGELTRDEYFERRRDLDT